MSKEKETDAATVLSQMSQLVGVPSFDLPGGLSSSHDVILEGDSIGATCTLQPSSIDSDILFPLSSHHHSMSSGKRVSQDPYIGFDDTEHPYAANFSDTNTFGACKSKLKDGSTDMMDLSTLHQYTPMSNEFVCTVCEKQFKTHSNLQAHLKFHERRKQHTCVLCSKSFTTPSDLKRHFKIHCKDLIKTIKCEECGKEFRDQATKTRHMKIHSKSALMKCDVCDKEFSRKDSYSNHMRTHLTSKPFVCSICCSEFAYKSSFNRHMLAHDSESLHICDICGKAFKRPDYVDSHKKSVHCKDKIDSSTLVDQENCLDDPPSGKVKSKMARKKAETKGLKKRRKSKKNINAVPILMSMAENASKPPMSKLRYLDTPDDLNDLMCGDTPGDMSSAGIDSDLIAYINDDSSAEDVIDSNADTSDDNCFEFISEHDVEGEE